MNRADRLQLIRQRVESIDERRSLLSSLKEELELVGRVLKLLRSPPRKRPNRRPEPPGYGTARWRARFDDPEKHPRMLEKQRGRAKKWYERMRKDPEKLARFEARRKRGKAAWRERQKRLRDAIDVSGALDPQR